VPRSKRFAEIVKLLKEAVLSGLSVSMEGTNNVKAKELLLENRNNAKIIS
jgi:hypothetical protein